LEGNYRLYGWYAGYDHSKLDAERNPIDGEKAKGWGIGLSADQQITEMIGCSAASAGTTRMST